MNETQTGDLNVRSGGPPVGLTRLAERVACRLNALFKTEITRWSDVQPELAEPLVALRDLVLGGGKRLRPAFCYWSFVSAGGDPSDNHIVDVGAALELLHAFALYHDDVMDGSNIRRGAETTHIELARQHVAQGWRGEARRYGEGVAILTGDLAFVYADVLMGSLRSDATWLWNELRLELHMGQYLDLTATARRDVTLERSRVIARYKSGKYTVERPLHLGASLVGQYDKWAARLSAFGLPLGEAFQLRDDILGVFGHASKTGKPVGDDLREGKPTAMLALALEQANARQSEILNRVGAPDLALQDIDDIRSVLIETGAKAAIETRIDGLTEVAIARLQSLEWPHEPIESLVEIAYYATHRDH